MPGITSGAQQRVDRIELLRPLGLKQDRRMIARQQLAGALQNCQFAPFDIDFEHRYNRLALVGPS